MELPQGIIAVLDGIPQAELEQYLDRRKGHLSTNNLKPTEAAQ